MVGNTHLKGHPYFAECFTVTWPLVNFYEKTKRLLQAENKIESHVFHRET